VTPTTTDALGASLGRPVQAIAAAEAAQQLLGAPQRRSPSHSPQSPRSPARSPGSQSPATIEQLREHAQRLEQAARRASGPAAIQMYLLAQRERRRSTVDLPRLPVARLIPIRPPYNDDRASLPPSIAEDAPTRCASEAADDTSGGVDRHWQPVSLDDGRQDADEALREGADQALTKSAPAPTRRLQEQDAPPPWMECLVGGLHGLLGCGGSPMR